MDIFTGVTVIIVLLLYSYEKLGPETHTKKAETIKTAVVLSSGLIVIVRGMINDNWLSPAIMFLALYFFISTLER